MNAQQVLRRYVELCTNSLSQNSRVRSMLQRAGLADSEILDRFLIGYTDRHVSELVGNDGDLLERFERTGIISGGQEVLHRRVTIPVLDVDAGIVNIVGYSPWPNTKNRLASLNAEGIFNAFHCSSKDTHGFAGIWKPKALRFAGSSSIPIDCEPAISVRRCS